MELMAKRCMIIMILMWFTEVPAFASTHYVSVNGSDASGNGSSASPWKTIAYALTKAVAGDLVSIEDGTYSENQLVFPAGVSLTSKSQDKTKVVIQPASNLGSSIPFVSLISPTPGTLGNQVISHVTISGRGSGFIAYQGIKIQNRNNVRIHHCSIEKFFGIGSTSYSGGNGSWGLWVASTQISPSGTDWYNYVGGNYEKGTNYPLNPVTNFEFDYNLMRECGWDAGTNRAQTPCIYPSQLRNCTFHDNIIDATHSPIKPITATTGFWDHVDFYNNIISCHTNGVLFNNYTMWALEIWVIFDSKLYNNKLINAGFSTTYGNRNEWYYNYIDKSGTSSGNSYGIEATFTGDARIHHNYLRGNPSSGNMWGINAGSPQTGVPDGGTLKYHIWGNILQDIRYHGIFVDLTNSSDGQDLTVYVYNNTFDNLKSSLNPASVRFQQDVAGSTGSLHLKNNLFINNHLAYWTKSGTPHLITSNNLWYGNTTNSIPISVYNNDANKVTVAPVFAGYPKNLAPGGAGSQVNSGADLGDGYKMGLSQATDWGTGQQLPSVVLADQDVNGNAWEIGAYVYGTSVSAKSISSDIFKIYPNPVSSFLTIAGLPGLDECFILQIFDLHGREVSLHHERAGCLCHLDMTGLQPGFYILNLLFNNGKQVCRKIIKEN